jgi:RNA polymerase sigma-70 factor (ECF subfamily)
MDTDTTDAQDRTDVERLAGGDATALSPLMDRHATRLFHYLIRLLQNESEAEELAQETFVRVFLHAQQFNPARRFSTWLYTLATNLVRDRHRRHVRHPHVSIESLVSPDGNPLRDSLPAPQPDPAEHLDASECVTAVQRAIAELPEDLRVPIVLAEYDGASYHDIASILGCTAKSVEMRLYRARKILRNRLAHWLG